MYSVFIPEGVMTVDDQLISINLATLTEEIIDHKHLLLLKVSEFI